ncbi:hypothetical protein AMTRI_Chr05g70700 [Amborella trichopoda]
MAPYIFGKYKGILITNLTRTACSLSEACNLIFDVAKEQKVGWFNHFPKRDVAILKRQISHLQTYMGGIKYMMGLPNIVIIADHQEKYMAIRECLTLGTSTICLIDTDCDLNLTNVSIPTNDDAIASIQLILNKLVLAIHESHYSYLGSH